VVIHVKMEGKIVASLILAILFIGIVSAGIGIKWGEEFVEVVEAEQTCLSYGAYNPWPEDSYLKIGVSEELEEILEVNEGESILVPSDTGSGEAIPINLCFYVPEIYEKSCLFGSLFCEKRCDGEREVISGEVLITEVRTSSSVGQSSAIVASVSAPLEVEIICSPHSKNLSLMYLGMSIIAIFIVALVI